MILGSYHTLILDPCIIAFCFICLCVFNNTMNPQDPTTQPKNKNITQTRIYLCVPPNLLSLFLQK